MAFIKIQLFHLIWLHWHTLRMWSRKIVRESWLQCKRYGTMIVVWNAVQLWINNLSKEKWAVRSLLRPLTSKNVILVCLMQGTQFVKTHFRGDLSLSMKARLEHNLSIWIMLKGCAPAQPFYEFWLIESMSHRVNSMSSQPMSFFLPILCDIHLEMAQDCWILKSPLRRHWPLLGWTQSSFHTCNAKTKSKMMLCSFLKIKRQNIKGKVYL